MYTRESLANLGFFGNKTKPRSQNLMKKPSVGDIAGEYNIIQPVSVAIPGESSERKFPN